MEESIHFHRFRNADISMNTDDFLSEIEHFNAMIEQREKQIQENSFKVTNSSSENHFFNSISSSLY